MGGPEDEWYTIGMEEVLRILIPQELCSSWDLNIPELLCWELYTPMPFLPPPPCFGELVQS